MSVINTKQKKTVLKTPQAIVHIKHNVSLRQYKYWVLLLRFYRDFFEAGETPNEDGYYRISIAKITDYLGYEPVKSELKSDFEALRKQPIIINILDKDGLKAQRGMGFISEWEITSKTVSFKIPTFLEKVVKGDDDSNQIFQLLNWEIFNSFSGKYEAILYKLCKDYMGVGRTPYMTVEDYRQYIGLNDNEYTEFKKLNVWTITKPLNALKASELSEIDISVEYKRVGRKVIGLHFLVKAKQQSLLPFPEFDLAQKLNHKKVQKNISSFAGLQLILFRDIQKKNPEITEKYVRDYAEQSGLDIVQVLEKIKADYKAAEEFSLEKTD